MEIPIQLSELNKYAGEKITFFDKATEKERSMIFKKIRGGWVCGISDIHTMVEIIPEAISNIRVHLKKQ